MRAIIFANGILSDPAQAHLVLRPGDLVIAANGGAKHLQKMGLLPDVLIGDFDSLSAAEVEALHLAGTQVIRLPARKDFTDLELAIQHALSAGASQVLILGALGNRWDQTLANLLLAASAEYAGVQISLLDDLQELCLLRAGRLQPIAGQPGDTVSLIPLCGDAHGITTQDLEYPLRDETLYFGSTRGVSNVLLSETASVTVREGMVMCVVIHQASNHQAGQSGSLSYH